MDMAVVAEALKVSAETLQESTGTYGQRKASTEITTAPVTKMPGVGCSTWFGDQGELGWGIRCGFVGFKIGVS